MEYARTIPFTGRSAKALQVAMSTFIPLGFQITASTDHELRVTGPGITSTRESPLKGISEAAIVVRSSAIEMKAELGGVRKLKTFLTFFPLGMALLFLIIFGVLALSLPNFRRWWIFLIPLLALSPWIFLAPMMSRQIERRTAQAIDTLLSNMAMLASD
ncbi:MAG TPA: hypothetical protein VEV81_09465 [Pyrinomonadaceae bacterium]|nr:hypothetical protein [Pyrinomonadaceae bacterium]